VLSEDLSGAPDEGVKKFALALAGSLGRRHEVTLLSTCGAPPRPDARLAAAPRTFLSRALRRELHQVRPEVLIYIARSSATALTFLRCRVLKAYCPGATLALIGLQERRHAAWARRLIPSLRPDLVCVQSAESLAYLAGLGCRVALLPSGVDTDTYRPVPPAHRVALRARYGLHPDLPVALHVGHLRTGRGVRALADLAARGGCQVVLVTSSSTAHEAEPGLADELRRAGVIVLGEYLPQIEELYQLADCYVFPVASTDNCIGVPLSVLEALACDLPVVSRRFAALPELFAAQAADHPGLIFVDSPEALVGEALRLCRSGTRGTRPLALPYGWDAVAATVLDQALKERNRA
jgi:glycosyltransferase involved in cell wall biosynthesis